MWKFGGVCIRHDIVHEPKPVVYRRAGDADKETVLAARGAWRRGDPRYYGRGGTSYNRSAVEVIGSPSRSDLAYTVIDARASQPDLGLREIYRYRDLFLTLAYRDLRVRYAQTFLGLAWAFLQPAATLAVFTLVFGRAIGVPTDGVPYPLFALAGLVPWTYFAFVVANASGSLIAGQQLITKTYFPRLIVPLSKAVVGVVDVLIAAVFFLALALAYGWRPAPPIVYLPVFAAIGLVTALTAAIWLAALSIRYRDIQHVVPFVVQIGLYATPVAYPGTLVPERFAAFYYANPMAGVVEGVRWCLLGTAPPAATALFAFGGVLIAFVAGLFYFRRAERLMADLV